MNSEKATKERNMEIDGSTLGIRSYRYLAYYIAKENAYDNNLVSDISKVDYTKGNSGKTKLRSIPGIEKAFIDDIYVFGYLGKKDIQAKQGKVMLTEGKTSAANNIVQTIATFVSKTIGRGRDYCNVRISGNAYG